MKVKKMCKISLLTIILTLSVSGFGKFIEVGRDVNIKKTRFAAANSELIDKIERKLPEKPGFGPTINDREYWERLKKRCPINTAKIIEFASARAFSTKENAPKYGFSGLPTKEDIEAFFWMYKVSPRGDTSTKHLKFRNRSFEEWKVSWKGFMLSRLQYLVQAECLENKGRFLPIIERVVEMLCELPTWVDNRHYQQVKQHNGTDLVSTEVAAKTAMCAYILQDKLSPKLRSKLSKTMSGFIFKPFMNAVDLDIQGKWRKNILSSGAHWLGWKNNWNPVCLNRISTCAVMALDDRRERAVILAVAEKYMTNFHNDLHDDGYYSEGVGYWGYGFQNYLFYAEMLYRYTDGRINNYKEKVIQKMAPFGYTSMLQKDLWMTFGDVKLYHPPQAAFTCMVLNKRLKIKEYDKIKIDYRFPWNVKIAYTFLCDVNDLADNAGGFEIKPEPTPRHWFKDVKLLVSRDYQNAVKPFSGAIKGSHIGYTHTHSDTGSFEIGYDGKMLLIDPGYPVDWAKNWNISIGSYYHSVPVVDGREQCFRQVRTNDHVRILLKEFSEDRDAVRYDIRYAYPNRNKLKVLAREFVHNRKKRIIEVVDTVEFKDAPGNFESALMTYSKVEKLKDSTLRISEEGRAVRIEVTGNVPLEIKLEQPDKIITHRQKNLLFWKQRKIPLTRIAVKCQKQEKQARIVFKISPEK